MLILFAISLVGFGIYYQVQSISLPTDENIFSDPPSRVINTEPILGFQEIENQRLEDTVQPGSLIVNIDGIDIIDTNVFRFAINNASAVLKLKIFDRQKNILRSVFVSKDALLKGKFEYLKSAVVIYWVKSGGTSESAGLKPGDIIVSINNREFATAREADQILIKSNPEKPLVYKILRGAKLIEKKVQLTTLNITFDIILRYLIFAIFLFFALFLGLKHSEAFPIRLLSCSFLFISIIFLSVFSRTGENTFLARSWFLIFWFSLSFSFAFFSHFLLYFPVEQNKLISKKFVVGTIYLLTALVFLFFIFLTNLKSNYLMNLLSNLAFAPIVGYRLFLNLAFKKHLNPDQRNISKGLKKYFWFVIAIVIAFLLSTYKFPQLTYEITLFFYTAIAFFPILLFYLLNKYNFYGFAYRIRRNLLYFASRGVLDFVSIAIIIFGLYLLSITTIKFPNLHLAGTRIEVLNRPLPPEKNLQYEKIAIMLFSLVFISVIILSRNKINKYLHKKFHRARFDYKKTANDLSELIIRNINLNDLARNVIKELENTMLLKKAGLLIFRNDKLCCIDFFNENDNLLISNIADNFQLIQQVTAQASTILPIEITPAKIKSAIKEGNYQFIQPIRYQNKIVGCLLLGEKLSDTKYSQEDFEFLEIIAKNIAIAIENSFLAEELAKQERLKQELEIAQQIQLASLPKEMPKLKDLSISAITIPAYEVGGDFFDFLHNDGSLTIVVGDVSGKGTSAALYMSKFQGILRTLNEFNLPLKDLVAKANDLLTQNIEKNYFISAILCQFDTKNCVANLIRAGHLGLYYFSISTGRVQKILPRGLVLGVFQGDKFSSTIETETIPFQKGDCFVFVTDGVVEEIEENKLVSKEHQLVEVIQQNYQLEAKALTEKILTEVCFASQNDTLYDDLTILVVKPT